ncbi:MAG: DUF488 family protein [Thaumarchaeota archaeon]|nr:DUF488 family protein [Nitrososphaerota archaeon]
MLHTDPKRIYEKEAGKKFRVLVDGLWPRGPSKHDMKIGIWKREIAASDRLREWYFHKLEKREKFRETCWNELESKRKRFQAIIQQARRKNITLLYSAKDRERNNTNVLRDSILQLANRTQLKT